jgi:branched-chain amino acid transport system permease protein
VTTLSSRARELLRERAELAVLIVGVTVVITTCSFAAGRHTPLGIYGVGIVAGAGLALPAVGIVLVYRANRIINFAQLQMGAIAGTLFLRLVERRTFLRAVQSICPPCLERPPTSDPVTADRLARGFSRQDISVGLAPGWMVQLNYWLAFAGAIALTTLLVWLVYVAVIKRFNEAPRLVLTVVTLCSGQVATAVGFALMDRYLPLRDGDVVFRGAAAIPVRIDIDIDPAVFHTADLMVVVAAVAAGAALFAFFRYSRVGIVLRGAAENPQRAQTLGVNLTSITGRAWIIAGFLSGLAAVLGVAQSGLDFFRGNETLVRVLAAAVVGALLSLPLAIAGAVSVGVIGQSVEWATGSQALVSGLLVAVIVVLLVVQRERSSRAEIDSQSSALASRELRPIPIELRSLAPVRALIRIGIVVATLVGAGLPWMLSPSQTNRAVVHLLFIVVLLSLLVLTGWAGQISLAQLSFAAVGAYVTAASGLPFLVAVPAGAAVGAVVAALVGLPALRLRGQYLAVSSLAFALAVTQILIGPRYLGSRLPRELHRPVLLGIDFEDERSYYYLTLAFAVVAVLAVMGLRRSPIARTLIACKDNEQAAQAFGISLVRARLAGFALSGFVAAFAGGLFAFAQHGVPQGTYSSERSVDMFLFAMIGGFGSIAGPVVGVVYLAITGVVGGYLPGLLGFLATPSFGVIALLFVAPGGVAGLLCSLRDAWLRRLAERHRIDVPSLYADRKEGDAGLVPIAPKLRPGGGTIFVPTRFRMDDQWVLDARTQETVGG